MSMLTLKSLEIYVKKAIEENPELQDEIMDLYSLCKSEIEEGSPEYHEVGLCLNDINELIEEK
jgi:hypothetical protein